jgi:GTPase SAR1 family protein
VGNADTDMILVGSKADLENDRKVSRKQAEGLAEKYNLQYVEASAKEDANIGQVFERLTLQVI